jgi:aryl-alcohol dehydrogenase-like predicted oxidoreductase
MDTIELGRSGLKVTPICFGTWEFSGEWGPVDEDAATATIRAARDAGINFFDTAQAYGFGTSERILGAALASELRSSRDEIVLATKGGLRRTNGGLVRDASPAWLRRGVDESLSALNVDVIDLYQLHWPDPNTPVDESVGALHELVTDGKIRSVGVSNFDVGQMRPMERYALPDTLQPPYHMFRRTIEDSILPYCWEHDIGVLAYGPLAHGLLTGEVRTDTTFHNADWRAHSPDFAGETLARNVAVVDRLHVFAAHHGCSLPQLAIAWALAQFGVDAAIVGARRPAHVVDVIGAVDVHLSEDDLAALDRILHAAVPVQGPSPEAQPTLHGTE